MPLSRRRLRDHLAVVPPTPVSNSVQFRPPEGVSRKRWERAFGVEINPRTVRRALELVAVIPAMRRELDALSSQGTRPDDARAPRNGQAQQGGTNE